MKNRGFTILELLVAISVFVLITAAATGLFTYTLKAQRTSLAYQKLLDQTSYLMEHMSRTIRMAKKDMSGACTGTAKTNYAFSGSCLKFLYWENGADVCQQFCLVVVGGRLRLRDENGIYLTSEDILVSSFNVLLFGQSQNDDFQPSVTVFLDIRGEEQSRVKIQSTISQRNLDVRK